MGLKCFTGGLVLCMFSCTSPDKTERAVCAEGYRLHQGNCVPNSADESVDDGTDSGTSMSDTAGPSDTASTEDGWEIVSCDEPVGGIPWTTIPPDARGGFEHELEALDLTALPAEIPVDHMSDKERGFVAYALEVAPTTLGESIDRDAAIESGIMGQVLLGSIVMGDGNMDQSFFRRGMLRYYTCSRGFPVTLEGFKALYGWPTESSEVDSTVKCKPRLVSRDFDLGIHVAVAVDTEYAWETEIILTKNREDGQIDFAVYGPDNRLTDRSTFPSPREEMDFTQPVPHQCMNCHNETWPDNNVVTYDPNMGYTVLNPVVSNICL